MVPKGRGPRRCSCAISLGFAFKYGEGVEQSDKEAVRWYQKAADQGDAEAQFFMGFAYNYGEGVQQSTRRP